METQCSCRLLVRKCGVASHVVYQNIHMKKTGIKRGVYLVFSLFHFFFFYIYIIMVAKLIKPCASLGCCGSLEKNRIAFKSSNTAELILSNKQSSIPASVLHELCDTVYQMPNSLVRLASDIWSHLKNEPKKPSWCIQTTVVMGFLQAFRDQSQTNSLEFWRLMLIVPSLIKPLTSKTESELIVIKKRDLCGILNKMDSEETGTRTLDAEWMSAISTWERIYGSSPIKNTPLLLEPPSSCEKIVLYIHGGAYCTMSAQTHRTLTHKISKSTKRRVLGIVYCLHTQLFIFLI